MRVWVDMLQCADRSYSVGHTDEVETRVLPHDHGEVRG